MSEIDRGTMVGAGGAGLALAMLSDRIEPESRGNRTNGGDGDPGGTPTGPGFLYGDSVRRLRPNNPETAFNPQFVCAVYIKYERNGRPSIRHAYKALTEPKSDDEIRDIAEYILKDLRDDEYHSDIIHVRRNFSGFTMNTQQIIVLFLDNDPAIIRMNDDDQLEYMIRFSPYSGVPPYTERRKNFAFYNLHRIKMTKDEFECNTAYRLDFFNTDETGTLLEIGADTLEKDRFLYSMNIHLLQAPYEPNDVTAIPIILDPDTGNMGAEP